MLKTALVLLACTIAGKDYKPGDTAEADAVDIDAAVVKGDAQIDGSTTTSSAKGKAVKARVLVAHTFDNLDVAPNQIVSGTPAAIKAGVKSGQLDDAPEAVAYVESLAKTAVDSVIE